MWLYKEEIIIAPTNIKQTPAIFFTVISVSYTHLDVYKRQAQVKLNKTFSFFPFPVPNKKGSINQYHLYVFNSSHTYL